jgi:hypothetical protein
VTLEERRAMQIGDVHGDLQAVEGFLDRLDLRYTFPRIH